MELIGAEIARMRTKNSYNSNKHISHYDGIIMKIQNRIDVAILYKRDAIRLNCRKYTLYDMAKIINHLSAKKYGVEFNQKNTDVMTIEWR